MVKEDGSRSRDFLQSFDNRGDSLECFGPRKKSRDSPRCRHIESSVKLGKNVHSCKHPQLVCTLTLSITNRSHHSAFRAKCTSEQGELTYVCTKLSVMICTVVELDERFIPFLHTIPPYATGTPPAKVHRSGLQLLSTTTT